MLTVALVTILILVQYQYFMLMAGFARGKEIKAPAVSGSGAYDRANRVHLNTLEQLVITLPLMWICAYFWRPDVAAGLGVLFMLGRFVYRIKYMRDPSTRGSGFMIGFLANAALFICACFGVISKLV